MKLAALAEAEPRVFWLDDRSAPQAQPALLGRETADLAVVGGGYRGLWTALRAKERRPGLDVVLLEGDVCGSAASGRNGGVCDASPPHGDAKGVARWPSAIDEVGRVGGGEPLGRGGTIARPNSARDWA